MTDEIQTNDEELAEDEQQSEANDAGDVDVQEPEYQELPDEGSTINRNEINRFHDIKVAVAAELGRVSVPIEKLLSLGPGAVLQLDRNIDSPVELVAQGVPLASGEVVVVDDCFGIRITEVYPNKTEA